MTPKARLEGLLTEQVGDGLVIYDGERHQAHHLNKTAATVWTSCDGSRSTADLTAVLQDQVDPQADEEVVFEALTGLKEVGLLQVSAPLMPEQPLSSRRRFLDKGRAIGVAGAAASLLVPVITTMIVPPAHAQQSPPAATVAIITVNP